VRHIKPRVSLLLQKWPSTRPGIFLRAFTFIT